MARRKLSERQELQKQASREMSVYKRDDMIQKARLSLTLQEQRCVLYAISKIKPDDTAFTEYTFNLKDFYALCGIEDESYTRMKATLMKLKQRSWWMKTPDGEEVTVSWFNKVRTNKKDGKVTIRFDDDMMPYLLRLAEQGTFYTSYNLRYILPMSSQYSPRLYEILKSYQKNNREWFFEIGELKRLLNCENYTNFYDFKRFALEPAVTEINKYTDINVAYDMEKEGRKVTRVIFYMAGKGQEALLEAQVVGEEVLDGQVDLSDLLSEIAKESVKDKFNRENPIIPE